jgi:uncharacterized protein (DUF1810 family)
VVTAADPFDLDRFVRAQDPVYLSVVAELRRGRKSGHWMWFIFPQLRGLGHSEMAHRYGLASAAEAAAYRAHSLLNARLLECTQLVLAVPERSIEEILGYPDDLKFHSCMTLFASVEPQDDLFRQALERYYQGKPDGQTLRLLQNKASA